jgi:hypothetical protein
VRDPSRLARDAALAEHLASADDQTLASLLSSAAPLQLGVGGRSSRLDVLGHRVFVKELPLTDLERRPEHRRSTRNLFEVPLWCHYGQGGPGFSAWRELALCIATSGWVRAGISSCFPLLHHWRELPAGVGPVSTAAEDTFWDHLPAVRARRQAMVDASARLVLFSEYVPQDLLGWLGPRLAAGEDEAEAAIALVDAGLAAGLEQMATRGLGHFDCHFQNILTDGRQLYFADYGLALSTGFELSAAEAEFLARHRGYDRARASYSYLHCVSTSLLGPGFWWENLLRYLGARQPTLPRPIAALVERESARGLGYAAFIRRLREERGPSRREPARGSG